MKLRVLLLAAFAVLVCVACEDDSTNSGGSVELVTVAGIVRNIETVQPATGVRVRLLGTQYADEVATGTDGAFELKVPKGSKLWLVTDDFNASQDLWFPMINVDVPTLIATGDMLDRPIHACPQQGGLLGGFDNYLEIHDDANGDIFEATSVAEAGGIVMLSFWGCEGGELVPDGYTFSVSTEPGCPVGYWDPSCGDPSCSILYPPTRTVTDDVGGFAYGACAPDFTRESVTYTFVDTLSDRNLTWPSAEIPVKRGAVSWVWALWIDGNTRVSFKEFLEVCPPTSAAVMLGKK